MKIDLSSPFAQKSMAKGNAFQEALWRRSMEAEQAALWFLTGKTSPDPSPRPSTEELASPQAGHPTSRNQHLDGQSSCVSPKVPPKDQSTHGSESLGCDEMEQPAASESQTISHAGQATNDSSIDRCYEASMHQMSELEPFTARAMAGDVQKNAFATEVLAVVESLMTEAITPAHELAQKPQARNAAGWITAEFTQQHLQAPSSIAQTAETDGPEIIATVQSAIGSTDAVSSSDSPFIYWQGEHLRLQIPKSWTNLIQIDQLVAQIRAALRLHGQDPATIVVNHQVFQRPVLQAPDPSAQDRVHLINV